MTDQAQNQKRRRRQIYGGYVGKSNPSERDKIMHLLDTYRCSEGFVSEYLADWMFVSTHDSVKGGLRTIQEREAAHSRLLKARLHELGGTPQASIPDKQRQQTVALFASAERSDIEKLHALADLFAEPDDFLQPIIDLIEKIREDLLSKELLRTIIDDERMSMQWLVNAYHTLSESEAVAQDTENGSARLDA